MDENFKLFEACERMSQKSLDSKDGKENERMKAGIRAPDLTLFDRARVMSLFQLQKFAVSAGTFLDAGNAGESVGPQIDRS